MTHLLIRLGFVVASLSVLLVGYMFTSFGLHYFGYRDGILYYTVGIELFLAAIYLARKSRFIWIYALVTVAEALFLAVILFFFLLDISWFGLYYIGLVLANTFVVFRFLLPQRPEKRS
jgi:hypothetical protein